MQSSGLLSREQAYYVIKENFCDQCNRDIHNERGEVIGKLSISITLFRTDIIIYGIEDEPLILLNSRQLTLHTGYDIRDVSNLLLGRTKKTLLPFTQQKMWVEDISGQKILSAEGSYSGFDFSIVDNNNILIAQIRQSETWPEIFKRYSFDFSNTYTLNVIDLNYDRKLILGFVVVICNIIGIRRKAKRVPKTEPNYSYLPGH
ncbi:MAG: LURP-one-related family protein [Chloroflexi bacterium]|nr:LURP-one-related family protein [Chloroflexota bacterium]